MRLSDDQIAHAKICCTVHNRLCRGSGILSRSIEVWWAGTLEHVQINRAEHV